MVEVTCPTCDGDGKVHSHNPICWTCGGRGRMVLLGDGTWDRLWDHLGRKYDDPRFEPNEYRSKVPKDVKLEKE